MSTRPTPNMSPNTSSNTPSGKYRIFLLTVWQEDQDGWRFLLEDPRSGERTGFSGIDSLTEGLQDVIDGTSQGNQP